jgi:hypothetical protein
MIEYDEINDFIGRGIYSMQYRVSLKNEKFSETDNQYLRLKAKVMYMPEQIESYNILMDEI